MNNTIKYLRQIADHMSSFAQLMRALVAALEAAPRREVSP